MEWTEIQKGQNKIFVSKKSDNVYEFIKVNEDSNLISKGIVDLKSHLVNPILIEIYQKKKFNDSVDYVSSVFDQHGFSRYISEEKRFKLKEDSQNFLDSLKNAS